MDKFAVVPTAPTNDLSVGGGEKVTVSAYAPSSSTVTPRSPTDRDAEAHNSSRRTTRHIYKRALYRHDNAAETAEKMDDKKTSAASTFTASSGRRGARTATGATVRVLGFDAVFMVEGDMRRRRAENLAGKLVLRRLTPQAAGMRDVAVRQEKGYYKLRCGRWIAEKDVKVTRGETVPLATLKSAQIIESIKYTEFIFEVTQNVPMNGCYKDGARSALVLNAPAPTNRQHRPQRGAAAVQRSQKLQCSRKRSNVPSSSSKTRKTSTVSSGNIAAKLR